MGIAEAKGDVNIAYGFFGFDPFGGMDSARLTVMTRGADGRAARVPAHYELRWPTALSPVWDCDTYVSGPPHRVLIAGPVPDVIIDVNIPARGDHIFRLKSRDASEAPERDADGNYLDVSGDPIFTGITLHDYPDVTVDRETHVIRRPAHKSVEIEWENGRTDRIPAEWQLMLPPYECGFDDGVEVSGPPFWTLLPVSDPRFGWTLDMETLELKGFRYKPELRVVD
ncbi:hypothetical protein [Sphingomonas sp. DBB INV C78]|uniref:hypothetical protein n=1 Tax=Sphingomonas sp. DBB INV C78 TaxID=3349434 RepID=UPI0036D3179B